jgi:hypothetical protein
VHMAIDKLIPNLNKDEITAVAEYYDTLFFN